MFLNIDSDSGLLIVKICFILILKEKITWFQHLILFIFLTLKLEAPSNKRRT